MLFAGGERFASRKCEEHNMTQHIDWSDPVARLRLIEKVGLKEYNKQIQQHLEDSVVSVFRGIKIRRVKTQFGQLFAVAGTRAAFETVAKAERFITENIEHEGQVS